MARIERGDVDRTGWTALERATTAEHRWWDVEGLAHSTDLFSPRRLPALLAAILAGVGV